MNWLLKTIYKTLLDETLTDKQKLTRIKIAAETAEKYLKDC